MRSKTAILIGPGDHGRPMSLEDFDSAEGQEGRLHELGRGVVVAVDVPNRRHLARINAIKRQIHVFDAANPGLIHTIATCGECKMLLADLVSERHPDLAIYKTPPPDDDNFWATWVPEIVIEVVSRGSEH